MSNSMIWVTPSASNLAYELIMDLRIQQGKGLAIFLGFPPFYDNYSAIQLWVQRIMTQHQQSSKLTADCLRSRFLDAIPLHLQGVID